MLLLGMVVCIIDCSWPFWEYLEWERDRWQHWRVWHVGKFVVAAGDAASC